MSEKVHLFIGAKQPFAKASILDLLEHESGAHPLGWCEDTRESVSLIEEKRPDLVFLEVSPIFDGFEVLRKLERAHRPVVIMLATDGRHALSAYEHQVLDYLVEPLTPARLHLALQRARAFLNGKNAVHGYNLSTQAGHHEPQRLIVKDAGQFHFFRYDEIIWLESSGNYVRLHGSERGAFIRATMKSLAARLAPDNFLRIRNTAIINLDAVLEVRSLKNGRFLFVLRNGPELASSRGYHDKLSVFFKRMLWKEA